MGDKTTLLEKSMTKSKGRIKTKVWLTLLVSNETFCEGRHHHHLHHHLSGNCQAFRFLISQTSLLFLRFFYFMLSFIKKKKKNSKRIFVAFFLNFLAFLHFLLHLPAIICLTLNETRTELKFQ